jgi:tRNA 2-selenouridine synthase
LSIILSIAQFLEKVEQLPVADVRSPKEFAQGHIPGAVNIPLFDNEERALVGTRYKQAGKDAAVLLGLELVGPKMAGFVKQSRKLAPEGKLVVHCWRGGMRSGSFAWLLNTAGLEAATLQGGYKAYRQEVLSRFYQPLQLVVLGGKTGSGKTEVLQYLAALGEQVLDLEALAQHKGSSFGSINEPAQPSSEQFENNLHQALCRLDPARIIWIEDENKSIGTVYLPEGLWQQLSKAQVVFLDVPLEERIQRLVELYTSCDLEQLLQATQRIEKRLGGQAFKQAFKSLEDLDFGTAARFILPYYDKAYLHSLHKRAIDTVHTLTVSSKDPMVLASLLADWQKQHLS